MVPGGVPSLGLLQDRGLNFVLPDHFFRVPDLFLGQVHVGRETLFYFCFLSLSRTDSPQPAYELIIPPASLLSPTILPRFLRSLLRRKYALPALSPTVSFAPKIIHLHSPPPLSPSPSLTPSPTSFRHRSLQLLPYPSSTALCWVAPLARNLNSLEESRGCSVGLASITTSQLHHQLNHQPLFRQQSSSTPPPTLTPTHSRFFPPLYILIPPPPSLARFVCIGWLPSPAYSFQGETLAKNFEERRSSCPRCCTGLGCVRAAHPPFTNRIHLPPPPTTPSFSLSALFHFRLVRVAPLANSQNLLETLAKFFGGKGNQSHPHSIWGESSYSRSPALSTHSEVTLHCLPPSPIHEFFHKNSV